MQFTVSRNMKKLLTVIGVLASAMTGFAQQPVPHFESRDFMNAVSFTAGTNSLYGVTNLNSYSGIYSNQAGQFMTNVQGTGVAIGPGTNDYSNLLKDVDLWSLRDGSPPVYWPTNNGQTELMNRSIGFARIYVRTVGTNAAAVGVTHLRFVPLYDGTNETTLAGDVWDFPVVVNGVTPVALSTNAPMYLWVGARRLRLKEIYNTSVSHQGQSWIQEIRLNGWIP